MHAPLTIENGAVVPLPLSRSLSLSLSHTHSRSLALSLSHTHSLSQVGDALAEAVRSGRCRAVGVSNYNLKELMPVYEELKAKVLAQKQKRSA